MSETGHAGAGTMRRPDLPAEGGCRCGALRVRMTEAPMITSVCHCTGCQKMTGSAFSLTITLPASGLEVIQGESVQGGLGGDEVYHHHCPDCMSWVFTTATAFEGFVNLRATMLDDPSWFEPFIELQTAERLPWVPPLAEKRFERFPDLSDYAALAADYAGHLDREEG